MKNCCHFYTRQTTEGNEQKLGMNAHWSKIGEPSTNLNLKSLNYYNTKANIFVMHTKSAKCMVS